MNPDGKSMAELLDAEAYEQALKLLKASGNYVVSVMSAAEMADAIAANFVTVLLFLSFQRSFHRSLFFYI